RTAHASTAGDAADVASCPAPRRRLDEPMPTGAERETRDVHDLIVAHRVGELVGTRRRAQVYVKHEIELEGLADRALVLHDAMISMHGKAGDEYGIGHRALRIAAATRRAGG